MFDSFTEFAKNISREAGSILLQFYGNLSSQNISYKGVYDLVTKADQTSEEYLATEIEKHFPDHNIFGEEFTNKKVESDYTWIIDPLDGTTNFVHSHPFFAVSIGLQYKKKIVSGVVYAPILNEMFWATHDKGAYLNEKKIQVSTRKTLEKSLLATGFPYKKSEIPQNNLNNFSKLLTQVRDIHRCGSAALDLCYTACGRYDGYWELWLKPHDVAAGSLIVLEANGNVTDFSGGSDYIFGNNLVATNGIIHEDLKQNLSMQ